MSNIRITNLHSIRSRSESMLRSSWEHFPNLRSIADISLATSQEEVDAFVQYAEKNPLLQKVELFYEQDHYIYNAKENLPKIVGALPNIRSLSILAAGISDEAVPTLLTMKRLKRLEVEINEITNEGAKQLIEQLEELEHFHVGYQDFEADELALVLASCKRPLLLRSLFIVGNLTKFFFTLMNHALKHGKIPQLEMLSITGKLEKEEGILEELSTFLHLFHGSLTCDSYLVVEALNQTSSLKSLKLYCDDEEPEEMKFQDNYSVTKLQQFSYWLPPLAHFRALESLSIRYAEQPYGLLENLQNPSFLPNLKNLTMDGLQLRSHGIALLTALQRPIQLKLSFFELGQEQLDELLTKCQHLRTLEVYSTSITNLNSLKKCTSLKKVKLRTPNADLMVVFDCKQLKTVSLAFSEIRDELIEELFAKRPKWLNIKQL